MAEPLDLTQFEGITGGEWEYLTAQEGYPYEPNREDFLRYAGDCWDDSDGSGWGILRGEVEGVVICIFGNGPTTKANANLMKHAPKLLEELKNARAEVERLRAERERTNEEFDGLLEALDDFISNSMNLYVTVLANQPVSMAESLALALVKGTQEKASALIDRLRDNSNA